MRCAKPDARLDPTAGVSSRSNFELFAHAPPVTMPRRLAMSGPLVRNDPYPKSARRTIGGTAPVGVDEDRLPPEREPRTIVVQLTAGDAGMRGTPSPGALKSIGIKPADTVTRFHQINSGKRSGAPLPDGSLISISPIRKDVCDHEPRNPPVRAFSPTFNPPALKRSEITS